MSSYPEVAAKAKEAKELEIHQLLRDNDICFSYQAYVPFRNCEPNAETHAYLDFTIVKKWGVIVLEVDEDQHSNYDSSYDLIQEAHITANISLSTGQRLFFLRYNPDAYKVGGDICKTHKRLRHTALIEVIKQLDKEPPSEISRYFLFYDRHSLVSPLPCIAECWPEAVQKQSRSLA